MRSIFRVLVHVVPIERTDWPPECPGGYATVYLPAPNLRAATEIAEQCLLTDHYKPTETLSAEKISRDEFSEWTDFDGDPLAEEFELMLEQGGYMYDGFQLYVESSPN